MRKPENAGVNWGEVRDNLIGDVVVDDVFEINLIEVVGPGVEHWEALVLDALSAVLLDIFLDEIKVSLVGADRVSKIVLVDGFLGVADEGVDSLDAAWWLEVLVLDLGIESGGQSIVAVDVEGLKDANEHLLESLHVPILIDSGVDNVGSENLLGLVSQEENQIVHVVNGGMVAQSGGAEVGEELLEEQVDGWSHRLTEFLVFTGVESRELYFVGKGTADRLH